MRRTDNGDPNWQWLSVGVLHHLWRKWEAQTKDRRCNHKQIRTQTWHFDTVTTYTDQSIGRVSQERGCSTKGGLATSTNNWHLPAPVSYPKNPKLDGTMNKSATNTPLFKPPILQNWAAAENGQVLHNDRSYQELIV